MASDRPHDRLQQYIPAQLLAPQDVMPDERDKCGVLRGVIKSITQSNALQDQLCTFGYDSGVLRLALPKGASVRGLQSSAESIRQQFGGIKNQTNPQARPNASAFVFVLVIRCSTASLIL